MSLAEHVQNGTGPAANFGGIEYEETATLRRQLAMLRRAFGPVVMRELENPKTQDICLNQDSKIWVQRFGESFTHVGYLHPISALAALTTTATIRGTFIDHEKPVLETTLPLDGSRIEGLIPPVAKNASFAIRKPTTTTVTLESYRDSGILTHKDDPQNELRTQAGFIEKARGKSHFDVICLAIEERVNIVVVGATGFGKTTLVNAILEMQSRICPSDRVVMIEDTTELVCLAENNLSLLASTKFDAQACVKATMRLTPSRIVVGEVRDKAAFAMLDVWNTGHPGGLATFHANNARGALTRLENLVARDPDAKSIDVRKMIGEVVGLVVSGSKEPTHAAGRKIRELMAVTGFDGDYITHYL